jgi:hypothetical protein
MLRELYGLKKYFEQLNRTGTSGACISYRLGIRLKMSKISWNAMKCRK